MNPRVLYGGKRTTTSSGYQQRLIFGRFWVRISFNAPSIPIEALAPSRGVWCRNKDRNLYSRGSSQVRNSGRLSSLLTQRCRTLYQSAGRIPECLKTCRGNLPQNTFAISNRWSLSNSTNGCRLSVVRLRVLFSSVSYVFLLLCLCILIVMYALFCIFYFHRANWHSSATPTGFSVLFPQL